MPPSLLISTLEHVFQLLSNWKMSPTIAGGLAVSYWGHPRSTRDIDLAILVDDSEIFESRLLEAGITPTKTRNVVELDFVQVSQWRLTPEDTYIDIEIDFLISSSTFHRAAIDRAAECNFPGTQTKMRVLSCEDLLLFKAKSGRMIDLADIEVLLQVQAGRLDFEYLKTWSRELDLDPARWN